MKSSKFWKKAAGNLLAVVAATFIVTPMASSQGVLAIAEQLDYPYDDTFTISAYYSPLPCQNRYTTGSYEGDIRLNGRGTNGADGTPVFPGMIAAPKNYPFGLKIYIPGVGITSVHDRGGAIVNAGQRGHSYDRLDIWMGYGDEGLTRALQWGKRTVSGTVYGFDDSIDVQITLAGYSADEAVPNCDGSTASSEPQRPQVQQNLPQSDVSTTKSVGADYEGSLSHGMTGEAVLALQTELMRVNYFKGPLTGYYGDLTKHSVFKFQQSQGIVDTMDSVGAGIYGPRTEDRLREIINSREFRHAAVAEKMGSAPVVDKILVRQLNFGETNESVRDLQEILIKHGYLQAASATNYYGAQTFEAVYQFQLDNGIVNDRSDIGAGRVGPSTLQAINELT